MKMDHVAIVTGNAETMKEFYEMNFKTERTIRWTDGTVLLYFIEFSNGVKLELEQRDNPVHVERDVENTYGLAHLAIQVDTKEELEEITERMKKNGVPMRSGPTAYGEDFYESSFWDPDGNIVEITVDYDFLQSLKCN